MSEIDDLRREVAYLRGQADALQRRIDLAQNNLLHMAMPAGYLLTNLSYIQDLETLDKIIQYAKAKRAELERK